ncbi:MAG: galactose-1-phosphate uridylyltransferase [Syntrophorhabdaceae bacterium]|nr:galactose-1-phosphate uridylyltransferase [Syntrophorhabdaceae bacterium]
MPEVRLNQITGDWVIIARERAKRPEEFKHDREPRLVPAHSQTCPFCPGNEAMTPPETFRLTDSEGSWMVRSVPNKFSALTPEGVIVKKRDEFKECLSGVGLHEVIIESPLHNTTTALAPLARIEDILAAYRNRQIAFYKDERVEHVIIFKNHGEGAGTSLEHPHSQIVGTPVFPGQVMNRLSEAIRNYYYVNFGDCLYCTYMKAERDEGLRVICENDHFLAFVPYAALSPFHVWIYPKRHSACYGNITDDEIPALARILKEVLLRLYVGLGDPDFNYVIRSLSPGGADARYFHWYLAIVPRLTKAAGFELGTGMYINTSMPEESAAFLRDVSIGEL